MLTAICPRMHTAGFACESEAAPPLPSLSQMSKEPSVLDQDVKAARPQMFHHACLPFCSLEDLDDDPERGAAASLEVQGLVAPGMQSSSPKGALVYDRWGRVGGGGSCQGRSMAAAAEVQREVAPRAQSSSH